MVNNPPVPVPLPEQVEPISDHFEGSNAAGGAPTHLRTKAHLCLFHTQCLACRTMLLALIPALVRSTARFRWPRCPTCRRRSNANWHSCIVFGRVPRSGACYCAFSGARRSCSVPEEQHASIASNPTRNHCNFGRYQPKLGSLPTFSRLGASNPCGYETHNLRPSSGQGGVLCASERSARCGYCACRKSGASSRPPEGVGGQRSPIPQALAVMARPRHREIDDVHLCCHGGVSSSPSLFAHGPCCRRSAESKVFPRSRPLTSRGASSPRYRRSQHNACGVGCALGTSAGSAL